MTNTTEKQIVVLKRIMKSFKLFWQATPGTKDEDEKLEEFFDHVVQLDLDEEEP